MADDDLSGGGPSGPGGNPTDSEPGSAAAAGGDRPAEEVPQALPPAQALPPFQGFTSLPPKPLAGTAGGSNAPGSEPPAAGRQDAVTGIAAGVPEGYAGPGSAPPSYPAAPGYGAPYGSYGSPPYGSYGSPPAGSPRYGSPPGYPPYAPPAPPASGWQSPRQGWGAPGPYPPAGWPYQPGYPPAAYAPAGPGPGLAWGGIGERFGALMIDGVLLVVSLFALGLLVTAVEGVGSSYRSSSPAVTAISLIWWLLVLIYHPACWWVFGATLGQKALGLRVAQAANGQSLGIGAVLVRYLIFSIVTVIFPLGLISGAMASSDPFKRAWHDDVARSVVVRRLS
jgi:uncharacterized RDD family membrane protein YckC